MSLRQPAMAPVAPLIVAACAMLAAASMMLVPPASAQGTSSLAGAVCESNPYVNYIRAPESGQEACGAYLPGAKLVLKPSGTLGAVPATTKTATTDGNGTYQFSALADGDYLLNVTRAGFRGLDLKVAVKGATVRDWSLQGLPITLAGHVTGPRGEAVRGSVYASWSDQQSQAETDGAGAYKLATRAGTRQLRVEAPGYQPTSVTLLVDGTMAVDLKVERVPPQDATLTGRVTDGDGKPLEGVRIDVSTYGGGPYPVQAIPSSPPSSDPSGGYSGSGAPGYAGPDYCYGCGGGSNWTASGSDGRYVLRLFGGTQASVNAGKEEYTSFGDSIQVGKGATVTVDIQLLKIPPKTAHLVGRFLDPAGHGVAHVSLYIRNPQYGVSECSDTDEVRVIAAEGGAPEKMAQSDASMPYYQPSCAIHVEADGTFAGNVTPGYSILQATHNVWAACPEKGETDPACQPGYYTWSLTTVLRDGENNVAVRLQPRSAPTALIQGYVLDADAKPVRNVTLSFSNQDRYGYGVATTDQDGSYAIRVRAGMHLASVVAKGFYSWEGSVDAQEGTTDFDVRLTAGHDAGCCFGGPYPMMAEASKDGNGPAMGMVTTATASPPPELGAPQSAAGYEDLGGHLGPYNAEKRGNADGSGTKASPLPVAILLAALVLAIAGRRRA